MRASSGRAIAPSTTASMQRRSAPSSARRRSPASRLIRAEMSSGSAPIARPPARRSAREHEARIASIVWKQSRVGLGMRRTAGADEGLSKDVVQRHAGPVDRDRAEQGAKRERTTVALRWRLVQGAGEQLGAAKRRIAGDRVGQGACRGTRPRVPGRSSRWRRSCSSGALGHGVGVTTTKDGRMKPAIRLRPAGRWKPVIGAPTSIGIAATSHPLPRPPSPSRSPPAAECDQTTGADVVDDDHGGLVDWKASYQVDAPRGVAYLGDVGEGPLGGEQLEGVHPVGLASALAQ